MMPVQATPLAASRKSHTYLRLRTSMLIPIALIAGFAAHLFSRFVFPPAPLPPATEVQSSTTNESDDPSSSSEKTPGIWQQNAQPNQPQSNQDSGSADADSVGADSEALTSENQPSDETLLVPSGNQDFVMVPAGQMQSPDNPDEMIKVWLMQPQDGSPATPVTADPQLEAVGAQ